MITADFDNAAVDAFAAAMKNKLADKRRDGYGGWQTASVEALRAAMLAHVDKRDPVDIANYAMFIWYLTNK